MPTRNPAPVKGLDIWKNFMAYGRKNLRDLARFDPAKQFDLCVLCVRTPSPEQEPCHGARRAIWTTKDTGPSPGDVKITKP